MSSPSTLLTAWRAAANGEALAIIDAGNGAHLTHAELDARVRVAGARLRAEIGLPGVVALIAANSIDAVVGYLAALEAGCAVAWVDPTPHAVANVIAAYQPDAVLIGAAELAAAEAFAAASTEAAAISSYVMADWPGDGQALLVRRAARAGTPHADLAVLLQTSGSTGNPKLVRLSHANVVANARAIASYLGLSSGERSLQALPLQYSYGLSLLNSHLVAGAATILPAHSFLRGEFWQAAAAHGATSFAGVPFMYEALLRVRWSAGKTPTLRTLTQAGGRLAPPLIDKLRIMMAELGGRVFIMYGQTEATARMAFVPPDRLADKLGSIGVAIPGGELAVRDGELIYRGPNVMLGYAESAADLARGDERMGELLTGDLGRVDEDGFFYVTARKSRFAKLFGKRVGLDDVEAEAQRVVGVAVAAIEVAGHVAVVVEADAVPDDLCPHLCRYLGVAPSAVRGVALMPLPRTARGKHDYAAINAALATMAAEV